MAKHLYEPPPQLKSLQSDLSSEFIDLVERLMMKDPGQRLGSAREAAEQLERMAQRLSKDRGAGWAAASPAQTLRRRLPLGPLVALVAAALLALSAGAVLCGVALWRLASPPEAQLVAPVAAPDPDRAEQAAFESLAEKSALFTAKPDLGLDAWQDYLQRYPSAPTERRFLARMQVERLRERAEQSQRRGGTGRELDF